MSAALINVEEAAAASVAIDQAEHGHFVAPTALGSRSASLAANVGLIDFDRATVRAERRKPALAHRFADAVRQEPSGFDGQAKVRASWLELMPFLLPAIRYIACSHTCSGTLLLSKMVPMRTVKGLRHW
jgi:hypothetical protein